MRNPLLLGARVLALLAAFVATSMVAGVTASGLLIPAVGATDQVSSGTVDFFDALPTTLDQPQLSEKSVMLASNGAVIAQFYDENRIPIQLEQMSPLIKQAIVAVEDNRFYQHRGVDTRGIVRAAVFNAMHPGEGVQGASTLTMQYIRNLLVEQAFSRGDTAGAIAARKVDGSRKLREMKLAVAMEKKYDKDTILKGYLNIAAFGNSTYGVEAASRYYFGGKHASALTLSQAATLAATVQSPTDKNPKKNPKAAQDRRNIVLERMYLQKMITMDQFKKAAATPLVSELKITRTLSGCANADGIHMSYFCEYVREQIVQDPAFATLGKTAEGPDQCDQPRRPDHPDLDRPEAPDRGLGRGQRPYPVQRQEPDRDGHGHGPTRHRQGADDDPEPEVQARRQQGRDHAELRRGQAVREIERLPDRFDVQAVHPGHLAGRRALRDGGGERERLQPTRSRTSPPAGRT